MFQSSRYFNVIDNNEVFITSYTILFYRYIQLASACIQTDNLDSDFTRCREIHDVVEELANTTTNNNLNDDTIVDSFLVFTKERLEL